MKLKKIVFAAIISASINATAQNTYPTNGNVGIGTLSPSAKLDVNGRAIIDSTLTVYGSTNFHNNVILNNINNIDTNAFSENDFHTLILLPNGNIVKGPKYVPNQPFLPAIPCDGGSLTYNNPTWANGTNKIYADYCGDVNVGIGTSDPEYLLHVSETIGANRIEIGAKPTNANAVINGFLTNNYFNSDLINLGVKNNSNQNADMRFQVNYFGHLKINATGSGNIIEINKGNNKYLQLTSSGVLKAREIKVDDFIWPDFVFESTYSIMPLNEVETYININKHLPNIPSATEIKTNGLSLGKMQNLHMQKIEELTIYTIEQNKQIESLENNVEALQNQLDEIKALLKKQ